MPLSHWSSQDIFKRRTSTGSEAFSLLVICLDANKFVLLSFFSFIKTIYPRVSTKLLPNDAKSPLPIDVRLSLTLLLKLPNHYYVPFSSRSFDCQANEKIEPDIRLVLYLTSGSLLRFLAFIVFCLSWVFAFLVSVVLVIFFYSSVDLAEYSTIIPRVRMCSESIAYEAEGRMSY